MKAEDLDKLFDDNEEDIIQYFDIENATRPNRDVKKVNVDFPNWMVESLDREAKRFGVARQALIKLWLAERLEETHHSKN